MVNDVGDVAITGLVEALMRQTLREIIDIYGGGMKDGKAFSLVALRQVKFAPRNNHLRFRCADGLLLPRARRALDWAVGHS